MTAHYPRLTPLRRAMRNALAAFLVGLLGISACQCGEALTVQYASPEGDLERIPGLIEVRFDLPIFASDERNADALDELKRSIAASVHLENDAGENIAGEVNLPSPQTVQFVVAQALRPATAYTFHIGSGLRAAQGKGVLKSDYDLHFSTPRNGAVGLRHAQAGQDPHTAVPALRNMPLGHQLIVDLRYAENPARMKTHLRVNTVPMEGAGEPGQGGTPHGFTLVPLSDGAPHGRSSESEPAADGADGKGTRLYRIEPTTPWPKHAHVDVIIDKGLGVTAGGPLTTTEEIVLRASTYGPLIVVQPPECDECRPPKTLTFEMSTPVQCSDALRFLRIKTRGGGTVHKLQCVTNPTPTRFRVEPIPALEAHTKYRIILRPGLEDVFKQTLKKKLTFDLETGDGNPRFAYQRIFNVLEATGKDGAPPVHQEKVFAAPILAIEGARLSFQEAWRIIASVKLSGQVAWRELPWWLSSEYYYGDPCYWDDMMNEEVCDDTPGRKPGEIEFDDVQIPHAIKEELKRADGTASDSDDVDGWTYMNVPLKKYLGEDKRGGIVVLKATPQKKDGSPMSPPVLRLLNVTDIGLSAKYSPRQLVVLAASLKDNKPVTGAEVEVYLAPGPGGRSGNELNTTPVAKGVTDAQGVAVFSGPELSLAGAETNLHAQGVFVVVRSADNADEAFMWSTFAAGGMRKPKGQGPLTVGTVYTERGVYKPGEKVFYRAVARVETANGFSTPAGKVNVVVNAVGDYGGEGEEVFKETLDYSAYGTVHGSFELPSDIALNDYWVRVSSVGDDKARVTGRFKVAEFRRAEMKVTVRTDRNQYVAGDSMQVNIAGDYLFGAPTAGLKMRWSLRRSWGNFDSKRFPQASFTDYSYHSWYAERNRYSEFVDEGKEILDGNGAFAFTHDLQSDDRQGRMERLVVSATVEDKSGQSVSERTTVKVYPSALQVGIIPHGYLREVGKTSTYEVVVVDIEDNPVSGKRVKVSGFQDYWYSVKRKGPGGRVTWTYKHEEIKIKKACTGKTDSRGRLSCQFTPEKGGDIRFRARVKDKQGRVTKASAWFWVVGDPSYYGGRSERRNQVAVMPEAPEVKVGQEVTIAFTSPFKEGLALITVEREDILYRKVMPMGSNGTVKLKIEPSWAPNVYVSATVVRGRIEPEGGLKPDAERDKPAFALGYTTLKVTPSEHILNVEVTSEKKAYEPGQKAKARVVVKDHAGTGVRAEVNLFAVDEGVLMLTRYKTPDLIKEIFRERPYAVLAMDTRMHVLGERKYVTPTVKGDEDGGGGGDAQDNEIRKDFNPVAVWIGALTTEADGTATQTFTVPDTLTAYRLMAVAVGNEHTFGSGDTSFVVNKKLMMRQAMPRFVRPGDTISAGVVVNQLSGKTGEVIVELTTIDDSLFIVTGPRSIKKSVKANETVEFRFNIEAKDVEGAAEVVFSASMGRYRDKVQLVLPVNRVQPRESISVAGVLDPEPTTGQGLKHKLQIPRLARVVNIEVNASGLPVAQLEERIRGLVGYPYGCLEQRTSKILPLVAIAKLADKLHMTSISKEKIDGWVKEWITLVPKYQCGDGGFDYYPGCRWGSDAHLTAYAMQGMLTVKSFGYDIPKERFKKPAAYLAQTLRSKSQSASDRAAALRVLAQLGKSKPAQENVLFDARADMTTGGKTQLARALFKRTQKRDDRVNTLLADITRDPVERAGGLSFKPSPKHHYWSNTRYVTAVVLRTLLEVVPTDDRIPLIARGLVDLDNISPYYATADVTQSLLALAESVEKLTVESPIATVSVLNSKGKRHELFKGAKLGGEIESRKLEAPEGQSFTLEIENKGKGPLYFGAFVHYVFPATARLAAQKEGFGVTRRYTDRDGKPLGDQVKVGDYVKVTLTITPDERGRMVVVDDPLPAGLEPVDTSLATSDTEMAEVMGSGNWWRNRYRELRDDRTEWHFQRIWGQAMTLSYLTKAVTPGRYYAPGTHVERMYQPHLRGRAKGVELSIVP